MNKLPSPSQQASDRQTTTVFTSGNSQAVRLPKAFRIQSRTVEISRRGDEIVLREKPLMVRDAIGKLPPIEGLPEDISDQLPGEALSMEGLQ